MTRLLRNLLFAVLTFLIGVVISPIRFTELGIACGRGYHGRSYRSSYFVRLWYESMAYPSAEKADEAYESQLNQAMEIIERMSKFDKQGRKVGERAVVIYVNKENNERFAFILWTENRFFCSIGSRSLMHVLEFEKNHEDY